MTNLSPCGTRPPTLRRSACGTVTAAALDPDTAVESAGVERSLPVASDSSRAGARRILAALGAAKYVVDANAEELGRIYAVAGDGDHWIGMER